MFILHKNNILYSNIQVNRIELDLLYISFCFIIIIIKSMQYIYLFIYKYINKNTTTTTLYGQFEILTCRFLQYYYKTLFSRP